MTPPTMTRRAPLGLSIALLPLILALSGVETVRGQEPLALRGASGSITPGIPVVDSRGYAAFDATELGRLGWQLSEEGEGTLLRRLPDGPRVEVFPDTPFLLWGGESVQLADEPYRVDGKLFLPVQFLVDVLPWKLPGDYRYQSGSWLLEVVENADEAGPAEDRPSAERGGNPAPRLEVSSATSGESAPRRGPPPDPTRVVIIDAGHGGRDPGTVGQQGTEEKDVALGIARALKRVLEGRKNLKVYLTRTGDTLVPIWRRGEMATDWKGDRYGVFLSIHANALPNSPGTRGFETYFLSEARTEHERRVAALENAAQELEEEGEGPEEIQDMSFILSELRNLDTQHWSSLLAEYIQEELEGIHPGPNRGVKQGPLAVITNTLMPAVLVEVGFLSNRDEEKLLTEESFQEETAQALADAIEEFFQRYPPGPGAGGRAPQ